VFRTVCLAEPSKARNVLPRHKAAQKNSIQVHKQVSQTWSKSVTNTSQSWNAGSTFIIISSTMDGMPRPQAKAQTQVRATQIQ